MAERPSENMRAPEGADIYQFTHKPSGVDCLMKTPAGLQPPGENPPLDFLENYEGGWQELFPNPGDAYEYQGSLLPFQGEVALLPWDYTILRNDLDEVSVRLSVKCRYTPFRLGKGCLRRELTWRSRTITNCRMRWFSGTSYRAGGDFWKMAACGSAGAHHQDASRAVRAGDCPPGSRSERALAPGARAKSWGDL
jgi:hypothetical protein